MNAIAEAIAPADIDQQVPIVRRLQASRKDVRERLESYHDAVLEAAIQAENSAANCRPMFVKMLEGELKRRHQENPTVTDNAAAAPTQEVDPQQTNNSQGVELGFQILPVASIEASPTNPRKTFDPAKHEELTSSVKSHGVLQPILVRPHPTKRGKYELIAGERRWRASKAAKVATIPAMVKDLGDLETLEVQVIENLQREDIHPLEEATGYEALVNKHGFTVDQLAAKVGKSKAYVYARLKLCALAPAAREVFMAGGLDASTALLVARIPVAELQAKALKEIMTGGDYIRYDDDDGLEPDENDKRPLRAPMSYRKAAEHVRANYMLRLDQAPFDVKILYFGKDSAQPIAGSCVDCPKRTGNSPDLFGDVANDNVCTDPQCFSDKREAQGRKVVEEAHAKGREVLTGKDAKKVLPSHYSRPAGFVRLDDTCYDDEKHRPWRKVLGKDAADKVVLCENPDEPGTFVELVREKEVNAILKAKGIEKPRRESHERLSPAERKEELEREVHMKTRLESYLALREVVGRTGITNVALRAIAKHQLDMGDGCPVPQLAAYWGLPQEHDAEAATEALDKADGPQLLQMVLDVLVGEQATYYSDQLNITELATAHGIDVGAIEAKVRDVFKAAKSKTKGKAKAKPADEDQGGEGGEG